MIAKLIWIEAITQRPAITCLHLEVGEPVGLALEAVGELAAAAHRLPEQHPGDGERLLHERRDVRHRPSGGRW